MRIEAFIPDHAYDIASHSVEDISNKQCKELATEYSQLGPCCSLFLDKELIACCGIRIFWEGSGEAWALFAQESIDYGASVYLYDTLKSILAHIISHKKLYRVQALINTEFDAGIRYVEHLDFHREGLLEKFGPNMKDYYMYARITNEF